MTSELGFFLSTMYAYARISIFTRLILHTLFTALGSA